MKKLRTLLNEIGFVGLVSKTGFVGNPPVTMRVPKTSIKEEEEDWYGDDPGAPEPMYGDDDQFDDKGADEALRDEERITAIYNEGSDTLVGLKDQILELSEQIDENLANAFDDTTDTRYDQEANTLKKYFNNILRNIELTKKHLDAGF
jgi:hypothetical protein